MQNIHVRRYDESNSYQGSIEPDDRSWVVFIDSAGKPSLWVRRGEQAADGQTQADYVNVTTG